MQCSRRDFLKKGIKGSIAASLTLSCFTFLTHAEVKAAVGDPAVRWGFLVDTYKCVGCGFCVVACKTENKVPFNLPISRTWVERYVITHDGEQYVDSPNAGFTGYTTPAVDERTIPEKEISKAFFVPKLCNQCQNPPCVQVCPVGATYQTRDGVVLVDRSWCIGCGYCIMACPYSMRFFHPVDRVADKCTFCYHRITKGMKTACEEACAFGARRLADLKNPEDPVTKTIMTQRVAVLKDEYGTKPQIFYIGLDSNVR